MGKYFGWILVMVLSINSELVFSDTIDSTYVEGRGYDKEAGCKAARSEIQNASNYSSLFGKRVVGQSDCTCVQDQETGGVWRCRITLFREEKK